MTTSTSRLARLAPALLLVTGLVAAACSAAPGAASPTAGAGDATPGPSLAPPVNGVHPSGRLPAASGGVPGSAPEGLLELVRQDLQARLGVDVTNATVVSSEAIVFNDGSLGCPQPGMAYTQAIVAGYRLIVELDGQEYDYRAGERGAPVLCEAAPPGARP